MKLLLIEDEFHAAQRLQKLLIKYLPEASISAVLDSVEDSVEWLRNHPAPDLIFMDVQLADDLSFSIFQQVDVNVPVIFTTAFDQYALRAFKVNSIDYLLKPIDENELQQALVKYGQLHQGELQTVQQSLQSLLQSRQYDKQYRERFLLRRNDKYTFLLSDEIAYFYSEDSLTFIVTQDGKQHVYDATLNSLQEQLNPQHFFRINRAQIVHLQSISNIHNHFNQRLKLSLTPEAKEDVFVSRDKVRDFKRWLGA